MAPALQGHSAPLGKAYQAVTLVVAPQSPGLEGQKDYLKSLSLDAGVCVVSS